LHDDLNYMPFKHERTRRSITFGQKDDTSLVNNVLIYLLGHQTLLFNNKMYILFVSLLRFEYILNISLFSHN